MTSPVRPRTCSACPYRRDVPSGIWAEHEYQKLCEYDQPLLNQPLAPFACHATPTHLCAGWAHTEHHHPHGLLALRLNGTPPPDGLDDTCFPTGREAAEHGRRDIANPGRAARQAMAKLAAKYPRLNPENQS